MQIYCIHIGRDVLYIVLVCIVYMVDKLCEKKISTHDRRSQKRTRVIISRDINSLTRLAPGKCMLTYFASRTRSNIYFNSVCRQKKKKRENTALYFHLSCTPSLLCASVRAQSFNTSTIYSCKDIRAFVSLRFPSVCVCVTVEVEGALQQLTLVRIVYP